MLNGYQDGRIELGGVEIPKVSNFKNLGSTIKENGNIMIEKERKVQAEWNILRKVT